MQEVQVACPCCKNKRLFDADPTAVEGIIKIKYGSYPASFTANATASSSVYFRLLLPSTILKPS